MLHVIRKSMLDVNKIRNNPEEVKKGISAKNADPELVDKFLELDEKWRSLTKEYDDLRASEKKLGKETASEAKGLKENLKKIESEVSDLEKLRQDILYKIPNLPLENVPIGKNEAENRVIRKWGDISKFDFKPKDHMELGESLDIIDTKTASKVSGSRFNYLKGQLALMEFAIVQYAFSILTNAEIIKKIASKIGSDFSSKPL